MNEWTRAGVSVRWCGGLLVETNGTSVLIDAPPDIVGHLPTGVEHTLGAVLVSSGRVASVGGLVALWCHLLTLTPRRPALPLHVPLGDERAAGFADAFSRAWPHAWSVPVDEAAPGTPLEAGPFRLRAAALGGAEPTVAWWVEAHGVRVVRVPSSGDDPAIRRAMAGAHLGVVDSGGPWGAGASAAGLARGSSEVWVVGPDGTLGGRETH